MVFHDFDPRPPDRRNGPRGGRRRADLQGDRASPVRPTTGSRRCRLSSTASAAGCPWSSRSRARSTATCGLTRPRLRGPGRLCRAGSRQVLRSGADRRRLRTIAPHLTARDHRAEPLHDGSYGRSFLSAEQKHAWRICCTSRRRSRSSSPGASSDLPSAAPYLARHPRQAAGDDLDRPHARGPRRGRRRTPTRWSSRAFIP